MSNDFEVIIVGGSYSGVSGAIQLARARRKILVIDAGERRNRFATHSHGFFGSDGKDPNAIAAAGKKDLLAYPTVTWIDGRATHARQADGTFVITANGTEYAGARVVLALGVKDELPNIPGVKERWGNTIFTCPYCHGYELNQGDIACLATMPASEHVAPMLPDWGKTTYFTNGQFEPEHAELFAKRGLTIDRTPLESVSDGKSPNSIMLHLKDGRALEFAGLVLAPKVRPASDLAEQLGCELEQGPMGPLIKTEPMMRETTVPGVFACGDAMTPGASIAFAVAEGARAAIGAHRSLIFR